MLIVVNDTATTDIYTFRHTLTRHDALPICRHCSSVILSAIAGRVMPALLTRPCTAPKRAFARSTTSGAKEGSDTSPARERQRSSPIALHAPASVSAFLSTSTGFQIGRASRREMVCQYG